jgi:hypothetical protein
MTPLWERLYKNSQEDERACCDLAEKRCACSNEKQSQNPFSGSLRISEARFRPPELLNLYLEKSSEKRPSLAL